MTVFSDAGTRELKELLEDTAKTCAGFSKAVAGDSKFYTHRGDITRAIVTKVDHYDANPHTRISADSEVFAGATALHMAVYLSAPNTTQILIDNAGDIDAQDDLGNTPAHYLASYANVDHCAKTDKKQNAALMLEKLIELDADFSIENNEGKTALDLFKESTDLYKEGGPEALEPSPLLDKIFGNHYDDLKPVIERLEESTAESMEVKEKILAKATELAKEMLEKERPTVRKSISIEEARENGLIPSAVEPGAGGRVPE